MREENNGNSLLLVTPRVCQRSTETVNKVLERSQAEADLLRNDIPSPGQMLLGQICVM